jgi:hypothetical protein
MLTPFVGNGLCVDLDVVDFEDLQQKLRIVSDALNRNRERDRDRDLQSDQHLQTT